MYIPAASARDCICFGIDDGIGIGNDWWVVALCFKCVDTFGKTDSMAESTIEDTDFRIDVLVVVVLVRLLLGDVIVYFVLIVSSTF